MQEGIFACNCRALGWHLLSCKGKAEMDAQQWEQDATQKQQRVAELEEEVQKVQQELQQRISSFQVRACYTLVSKHGVQGSR